MSITDEILKDPKAKAVVLGKIVEPESPKEENPEEPEKKDEPSKEEPKKDDGKPEYKWFKETFGADLDDEKVDEWKTYISKKEDYQKAVSGIEELKGIHEKYAQIQKENEELKNLYDPKKIFVSEEEEKRQRLLRKYPDYDPSTITKIIKKDAGKLDDLEVAKLYIELTDGDIYRSESDIVAAIEKKFDIDLSEGFDAIELADKNEIKKFAKDAKKKFKEIIDNAATTENVDILAERETIKQKSEKEYKDRLDSWTPFFKNLSKEIKDIELNIEDDGKEIPFKYALGEDFRKDLASRAEKLAADYAKNVPVDDNAKARLLFDIKGLYILQNLPKILRAFSDDRLASYLENEKLGKANPKPLKPNEPPQQKSTKQELKEKAENEILSRTSRPPKINF